MGKFDESIKVIKLKGFDNPTYDNDTVRELIDDIIETGNGQLNPMVSNQYIMGGVKVEFEALLGKLLVKYIQAINKGEGAGTEVMEDILELAEEYVIDVTLSPKAVGDTTEEQLRGWYSRLGFVEDGHAGYMTKFA
jgi:predicted GNAT family N-acyltransferase